MRRSPDGFGAIVGALFLLNLALLAGVIYVAIHFIAKWW